MYTTFIKQTIVNCTKYFNNVKLYICQSFTHDIQGRGGINIDMLHGYSLIDFLWTVSRENKIEVKVIQP